MTPPTPPARRHPIRTRPLPTSLLWVALAMASSSAPRADAAPDTGESASATPQRRILTGATVHPATGPALTGHQVILTGDTITDIVPADVTLSLSETDIVVDLSGHHLYPGLISPTTSLGLVEIEAVRATRDTTDVGAFTPDVFAWVAVHPDSELIPVARANGFTHAQPLPAGGVVPGHSCVIQLDGWTNEDMTVRPAAALHVAWPSFRLDTRPRESFTNPSQWRSLEDQVRQRQEALDEVDAFFEQSVTYARGRDALSRHTPPTPASGSGPKAQPDPGSVVPAYEAMLPVLRGEIPVFIHADDAPQIRSAVEWARKRDLKCVIVGGRDAARIADFLAGHDVPVIYEHVFTEPFRTTDPYDVHYAAPATLAKAGVRVAFSEGTARFGASNVRNLPYAVAQAVAFGLSPEEGLRGLTLYPAQCLGVADRLGSIETGKEASLIAVRGDILDLRSEVTHMWIAGRPVSLESRHTRLYDRYRARPPLPGTPRE